MRNQLNIVALSFPHLASTSDYFVVSYSDVWQWKAVSDGVQVSSELSELAMSESHRVSELVERGVEFEV